MSNLSSSWETFVSTVCNACTAAMNYMSAIGSTLSEDAKESHLSRPRVRPTSCRAQLANRATAVDVPHVDRGTEANRVTRAFATIPRSRGTSISNVEPFKPRTKKLRKTSTRANAPRKSTIAVRLPRPKSLRRTQTSSPWKA